MIIYSSVRIRVETVAEPDTQQDERERRSATDEPDDKSRILTGVTASNRRNCPAQRKPFGRAVARRPLPTDLGVLGFGSDANVVGEHAGSWNATEPVGTAPLRSTSLGWPN